MPEGQVVTLDCAYGSATVTRFLRGSGMPNIGTGIDLAIIIAAGQDIILPGPYVEATGPGPTEGTEPQFFYFLEEDGSHLVLESGSGALLLEESVSGTTATGAQPFRMVQPIPQIVVTRPDGVYFVYPATIIGDRNFQGRLDYSTPVGIVEAGTLCRAIMPAVDLSLAGTYSAYLHFDTVSTALGYFLVVSELFIGPPDQAGGGGPVPVPPVPPTGPFDFNYPDFNPQDFFTPPGSVTPPTGPFDFEHPDFQSPDFQTPSGS